MSGDGETPKAKRRLQPICEVPAAAEETLLPRHGRRQLHVYRIQDHHRSRRKRVKSSHELPMNMYCTAYLIMP